MISASISKGVEKKNTVFYLFSQERAFHEGSKLIGSILDTEADRIFVRAREREGS